MSEDQRLEQKINECQEQFERLSAVIEALKKDYDYEIRAEAKIRIKAQLEEREQERQAVEQQLGSLEAERKRLQFENDRRPVEEDLLKLEDELTTLNAATATPTPHPVHRRAGGPIKLFYSYAHEDEALRERLETHLKLLKRQGVLQDWHDRDISAGSEWAQQISAQLETADIILLLISPDFIASDYCWDVELQRAMARHEAGEAVVIPVLLRETDWTSASFGKLQALPRDAKPVTRWADPDAAFVDIARGIRKVIAELTGKAV